MYLKRLIIRDKLRKYNQVSHEFVMNEPPMIYSIKFSVGSRKYSVQHFRNEKYRGMLKSLLRSYLELDKPVVLIVKYYLEPPEGVHVDAKALKAEKTPAVWCYELSEYLLSLQESLFKVLVSSYRQFCKVDMEKYYSKNPRTVFEFYGWNDYVNRKTNDTVDAGSKKKRTPKPVPSLQPKRSRNAQDEGAHQKAVRKSAPGRRVPYVGAATRDRTL